MDASVVLEAPPSEIGNIVSCEERVKLWATRLVLPKTSSYKLRLSSFSYSVTFWYRWFQAIETGIVPVPAYLVTDSGNVHVVLIHRAQRTWRIRNKLVSINSLHYILHCENGMILGGRARAIYSLGLDMACLLQLEAWSIALHY